jgi:lipopolysaccharide transport system permease protein
MTCCRSHLQLAFGHRRAKGSIPFRHTMTASHLRPGSHFLAFGQLISLLTRYRQLTWEMTKREVSERYAGQVMGTLWAVGHPVLLMALYVFIFAFVFPTRLGLGEDLPRSYVLYILAGLIPWITFADALNKSTAVIIGNSGLVKQVAFPLEILPVKVVLATFVTQLVATPLLLLYALIFDPSGLPWSALALPVLFGIQVLAMIGVAYLLSSVTVFVRDLRELVQVFTTAGLFLAPILFLPAWLESAWKPLLWVLYLNPFSHLVWCYQDILYFGRVAHPFSWALFIPFSVAMFYGGYRIFRKLKIVFGDLL